MTHDLDIDEIEALCQVVLEEAGPLAEQALRDAFDSMGVAGPDIDWVGCEYLDVLDTGDVLSLDELAEQEYADNDEWSYISGGSR